MNYKTIPLLLTLFLILGSYKGYLALYEGNSSEPCQIFHCRIDTLPSADQEKLASGIRVRDRDRLADLLEDYLS